MKIIIPVIDPNKTEFIFYDGRPDINRETWKALEQSGLSIESHEYTMFGWKIVCTNKEIK